MMRMGPKKSWPMNVWIVLIFFIFLAGVLLTAGCSSGKNAQGQNPDTAKNNPAETVSWTKGVEVTQVSNVDKMNDSEWIGPVTTTEAQADIVGMNNSDPDILTTRDITCHDILYKPVFLLGNSTTTRIIGHETKSINATQTFCTKFGIGKYPGVPLDVMKFDLALFDQDQIYAKVRQEQEINVRINGKDYKALLKEMNFNPEDIGIYSYSGVLSGVSQSRVVLTISKNVTFGEVTLGYETFYFEPVGLTKDVAGNTSHVHIIYNQKDVEEYRIDLSNDVITVPIPVRHWEST
jgi:hypothetical protein